MASPDISWKGAAEALQAAVFRKRAEGWSKVGNVGWRYHRRLGRNQTDAELLKALEAGDYRVIEPRWKSLEIGHSQVSLDLPDPR